MNGDADDGALRALARRLGAGAAERLDVERTAATVVQRLREQPGTRRAWLRIAAAVAVLLGGGFVLRQVLTGSDAPGQTAYFVADDIVDLTPEELREVLAAINDTTELEMPVPDALGGSLEQLDAQQLRAVLRTLEG